MSTIDYLPIANGGSANVESQAQYVIDLAGGGSLENGYEAGLAKSVQFNKTMRQSSMIAAAIATFISQQLGISVLDDGVLSTLVTNLTNAVRTANQAGQCRLSVTSTTALKLSPFGGNHLTINGVSQVIPAAGVSVTNGGLASSTLYRVYAFMNAGVMTLECSATGHSTDVVTSGNIGVEIKTGDPTRSLVGMIFADGSGHFIDTFAQRYCLSWFNRVNKVAESSASGIVFSNTGAVVEITSTMRGDYLQWSDETPIAFFGGIFANDTAGGGSGCTLAYDSTTTNTFGNSGGETNVAGGSGAQSVSLVGSPNIAEGRHFITVLGATNPAQTATMSSGTICVITRG